MTTNAKKPCRFLQKTIPADSRFYIVIQPTYQVTVRASALVYNARMLT